MATQMNEPVFQSDLASVRLEMQAMEERLIARIAAEISRAKFEMLTWGIAILFVNDGILLAAMKLFI